MRRSSSSDSQRPVTVITGASSGIGRSAAKLFAERGDTVVLVARSVDRLNELAGEIERSGHRAVVRAVDLADPEATSALVGWVETECGRLDNLINNAGFGMQCRYESMPWDDVERMFRVNVLSLMALSKAAIPLLKQSGGGSIVNVSSVGGVVSHPLNVAYCASKHAVVGFSKSLALELHGTGIRVVVVCPGATSTEFFDRAERDIPFDPMIEKAKVPPEMVAKVLVKATAIRRPVVFPTWGARLLFWADRALPWLSRYGNVKYRDRVLAGRQLE